MNRFIALFLICAACGSDNVEDSVAAPDLSVCQTNSPTQVFLVRQALFARAVDGVSDGFNLDEFVSSNGDREGCGVADYIDVGGLEGIDNAMAGLLPLLETTEASALEPILQESINSGAFLLMFEVTDFDQAEDGVCADVSVFKGVGQPMIGNDGWLLANQTVERDMESPVNMAGEGIYADGSLTVGPIDKLALTLQVLDLDTVLEIFDARIRFEPQDDGTWRALMGGGLNVDDLIDVATLQNVDPEVFALIGPVLALLADLAPDESGVCTQLSVTLDLTLVPAFTHGG
ncbi:MAG: hypothetical protein GWP91_19100 [Rhodobacterales bacterium]|nr:hypothetical protein [Rhodobacterales bacterium]